MSHVFRSALTSALPLLKVQGVNSFTGMGKNKVGFTAACIGEHPGKPEWIVIMKNNSLLEWYVSNRYKLLE